MSPITFCRLAALFLAFVSALRADYETQVTGSTSGSVWGSGPYTDDSSLGAAAVHAGLISAGQSATIRVIELGPQANFSGSTSNGVTTYSWSSSWNAIDLELVSSGGGGGGGGGGNNSPSASISGSTSLGPGESGSWNFSASDPDGNLYRWRVSLAPNNAQWTYISGGSQSSSFNYSFSNPGTYTFNLEVEDGSGATASDSVTIYVNDSNSPPEASLSFSSNPVATSSSLTITASASDADSDSGRYLNSMGVRWQNHDLIAWWAVSGTSATRTHNVTMPSAPGTEYFRGEAWDNASAGSAGDWQAVVVVAAANPSVAVTPVAPQAGGSVTVTYADAPDSTTWIGLFAVGASNSSYLAWAYVPNTGSGTKSFTLNGSFQVGQTYEARMFPSNGNNPVASSNTFNVTSANPTYSLTVLGGTANASGLSSGTVRTIVATPQSGQTFVRWSMYGAGNGTIGNAYSATTTFTIGTSDASVQALYDVPPPHYLLTVVGGTAVPAGPQPAGAPVTITAAPGAGQAFASWTHSAGPGLLTSTSQSSTTFTLGAGDATVQAAFVAGDGIKPSPPGNLAASNVTATSVALSWSASTDNVGVTGYQVWQNGSPLSPVTGTSTTVSGLASGTAYQFQVRARDAAGNWSDLSMPILNVTTTAIAPVRLALQYWQAYDYPGYEEGYEETYWVDGYWGYSISIDWDAWYGGDWGYHDEYHPDGSYWGSYPNIWILDWYWVDGYWDTYTETQTYQDGYYGSNWSTNFGYYNIDSTNSGYAPANANRGSLSYSYYPGQQITFRAWGLAPAGNCNTYEAKLYAPGGALLQSGTFASNSYWQTSFYPSSNGVHRVDISYLNATGGANPASATVSYFIPVGSLSSQSISFAAPANRVTSDLPFALNATASSGLPVSYSILSGPATVAGNQVTLTGLAGTVVVRASQNGGTNNGTQWGVATPVDRSFTVSLAPPTIAIQPVDRAVGSGQTALFSLTASGQGLTYQWQRKGVGASSFAALPENPSYGGVTTSSLSVNAVVAGQSGDQFRCIVTNTSGNVISNTVTLTVNTMPAITMQPVHQIVPLGATATFTVVATGTPTPTYQWRKGGVNISGATSATLTRANAQIVDMGNYDVVVTNSAGSVTSAAVTLTILGQGIDLKIHRP